MLKKIFTQNRFPRLWLLFQYVLGGIKDKRKIVLKHYTGQKRVLEIGCSVGIVSKAFTPFANIEFTGIDIDDNALSYAKRLFKNFRNFRFLNISLSDLGKSGEKFDYVIFANILHHTDDTTALELLNEIKYVLAKGASLIVVEPEKSRPDYNLLYRFFYLLEQGQYRRPADELANLIKTTGMEFKTVSHVSMAPNAMPFVKVATCIVIEITVP
jgi:ubiquinone/menaquinone biosynthesis C-methylase UbiE